MEWCSIYSQEMATSPGGGPDGPKYIWGPLCKSGGRPKVDFKKVVEKVESLQFLEIMVVRHFRIEEVIVVKRLFFSKLVLPRFVVFLRSLEGDMNKTLRIKSRRSEEEMMKMRNEEDEWFK
ncbi:hypothetical protein Tco_0449725 [Tanacetum coccineum]